MAEHEKFKFSSLDELREKAKALGLDMGFSEDLSPLARPVKIGNSYAHNSLSVLPMEGCDATTVGTPTELTTRRYLRFAEGGYGLIWWEACAVCGEGRANGQQLWLTEKNAGAFGNLLRDVNSKSEAVNGFSPVNILQLTHSGRYSRPEGHAMKPIITHHDPYLDEPVGVSSDFPVASDEYLDSLVPMFVQSARLAMEAGFDGVDIKCCHRYLFNELLAGYTREGKYGGSLENRGAIFLQIIREIKKACGNNFIVACRLNVYDGHPYPYGFGCSAEDMWTPDLSEPIAFVKMLREAGVGLLSCSAGNPYYKFANVCRPYDSSDKIGTVPQEHPLESVARLFTLTKAIQAAAGDIPVVGSGYTWLRSFMPYAAAANLSSGACTLIGLGRSAIAYPGAPSDIFGKGAMSPDKCCVTCGKCTQIMRDHGSTGCVIRDQKVYLPFYVKYRAEAKERQKK